MPEDRYSWGILGAILHPLLQSRFAEGGNVSFCQPRKPKRTVASSHLCRLVIRLVEFLPLLDIAKPLLKSLVV